MKRSIKFLLVAVLTLGSTALFAQKFGRLDYSGTLMLMPEIATVQTDLQKVTAEYETIIQGLQAEQNKLMEDYQKLPETTAETTRNLKIRELQDIDSRIQDYYQLANEEISKARMNLMLPLKAKLDEAVKKVCKAKGIVVVFQTVPADAFAGEAVYIDEEATIDINADVRKELGIAADAVAPAVDAPAPAAQ